MMRCAQRGCEVPEGTDATGFCPVCNNPLQIVLTDEPEVSHAQLGEDGPLLAVAVDGAPDFEPAEFGTEGLPPDNGVGSFPS